MASTVILGHVLVPFPPQWAQAPALRCTYNFANAVADSPTGREERAKLRPGARRDWQFTLQAADAVAGMKMAETLRAACVATRAALPLWARADIVSGRAGAAITLAAPCGIYAAGGWVIIADAASGEFTARQIAGVAGNVLTLTGGDAPASGDVCMPILFGRLDTVQEVTEAGQARAFSCHFRETPKPPAVAATWEAVLQNTYFLIYIDTSGSMDADVPAITAAAGQLKNLLRDNVYNGDGDAADEFVRVITDNTERWLEWLARPVAGELSTRYVKAGFINESQDLYHALPRVPGDEPTATFSTDYAAFAAEWDRCDLLLSKIYAVRPSEDGGYFDFFQAFQEHLAAAVAGGGGYAALGTPLAQKQVTYLPDVPSGLTADFYYQDLLQIADVFL